MSVYIYYHVMDGSMTSEEMTLLGLHQYMTEVGIAEQIPYHQVTIAKGTPHKKPYFKEYKEIFHNVSHSGDWWVCAYSLIENGVDLQKVVHKNMDKVAKRYLHPLESAWLKGQKEEEFSRIWAYNESYVKWKGDGLTEGLSYFSVVPEQKESSEMIDFSLGVEDACQKEIPFVEEDYYLVVTTKEEDEILLKKLEI